MTYDMNAGAEIPRRARYDQLVPAERAIRDAMRAVDAMPAHPRLTEALVLLDLARNRVADFVDEVTP